MSEPPEEPEAGDSASGETGDPVEPDEPAEPGGPVDPDLTPKPVTELNKPSTIGGFVYLGVLAAALVGLVVAATGAWRTGVSWLAIALLVAAGARVMLRDDDAGMLRVRSRVLDVGVMVVMAVLLLFLAATIPDQPR